MEKENYNHGEKESERIIRRQPLSDVKKVDMIFPSKDGGQEDVPIKRKGSGMTWEV